MRLFILNWLLFMKNLICLVESHLCLSDTSHATCVVLDNLRNEHKHDILEDKIDGLANVSSEAFGKIAQRLNEVIVLEKMGVDFDDNSKCPSQIK